MLANYNPDVLTCLANLSNDEVFTPPELVNQMLDMLPSDLWSNKDAKFLDPVTKSGVFLREIAKRLNKGLEAQIPDLQTRLNHIFTEQLYGIGITELTSLLARRSVYCAKKANSPASICTSFSDEQGNIRYQRTQHTWVNGKCNFCGASQEVYDRDTSLETHAYEFIHTDNPSSIFGKNMKFDVIIGNPPYQLSDGGVGGAIPLYQKFVQTAKLLEPRYLIMVTPSRWFAGGRGLDRYREEMLSDKRLRVLVDYPKADEIFPGVLIGGGVSYFLWDANYHGMCSVTVVRNGDKSTSQRDLSQYDIFVRSNEALSILEKVLANFSGESFAALMSGPDPFGFRTNFNDYRDEPRKNDVKLHYNAGGRGAMRAIGYVSRDQVTRNVEMIDSWKLMLNRVYNVAETYPHRIVGSPLLLPPTEICTGSFLVAGGFATKAEAESAKSYYETKFFRFLLHLRKINQDAARHSYQWVPMQMWNKVWTDSDLYSMYGLTTSEINYIESIIKPISLDATEGNADE
jgi:site-specific DNA-methyltransferase (adenine-specific)